MTASQDAEIRRKSLLPYRIRIEPRMAVPRWLPIVLSVGAVILGLVLGAIILRLAGEANPLRAYVRIASALFGTMSERRNKP